MKLHCALLIEGASIHGYRCLNRNPEQLLANAHKYRFFRHFRA
jgi:hypothetical protein